MESSNKLRKGGQPPKMSGADLNLRELEARLREKEQTIEFLGAQLSSREAALRKITSSLGWRILSRYGKIKYRYLLPVYRLFRSKPQESTPSSGICPQCGSFIGSPFNTTAGGFPALPWLQYPRNALPEDLFETNFYEVVCFPIIDWDFRFQRPQQLMARFAAAGHRVFYIAQNFRSSGPLYSLSEKGKNIFEVTLKGPSRHVYQEKLDDVARDELLLALNAMRRDLSLGATLAVVQLPFWWPIAERARREFAWPVVYDCMDYHAGFSTNRAEMIEQESDLISQADHVVASSITLEEETRRQTSKVLLLPNACDYEHFACVGPAMGSRPVVGYYGAIAEWFNSDLVADLAKRNPQWDFMLIGSTDTGDVRQLAKLPNVTLIGEKPYVDIPSWLDKFNVVILPFKLNRLTQATNPVKIYEILASGKPLVSVPIPEVSALAPMIRLATTPQDFEQEIIASLQEPDSALVESRRAFARENTWEKRFEVLGPVVHSVFPKASIIIVTYNNLSLNRLCLASLFERTEWPNFEVFVVDNGSTDGTREYLLEAQNNFPDLQVILNEKNLGFAAANNIGLQKADGDFVVFLNNDTVVPRGWLSALIRHLNGDSSIGLIGPVTNAIGNEAMIQVGYEQVEDMPKWAADYVRENDGRLFPIPMLALFCTVMRREVLDQVGPLDERFGIGMFEDDDFNHRIRDLGLKILCARDSFVHHWMKASFNLLADADYSRIFEENRKKYEEKWGEAWKPHCSTSPNPVDQ